MPEWWTYSAEDFLLFSPRTYWRLIERHNEALWPTQLPALLLGIAFLWLLLRPRPWSHRAVAGSLAVLWGWVAWSFLWERYATINWAAAYIAPLFALQAVLLALIGSRLRWSFGWTGRGVAGLGLFLYALVLHPLTAPLTGRSIRGAEVFGILPDPTAIATLGLVMMAAGRWSWLLIVIPLLWCLAGWATLHSMEAAGAWVLLATVALSLAVPAVTRRHPSGGHASEAR